MNHKKIYQNDLEVLLKNFTSDYALKNIYVCENKAKYRAILIEWSLQNKTYQQIFYFDKNKRHLTMNAYNCLLTRLKEQY